MVNNTTNINKTKERLNLACSTMEILIILCAWILASYIIEIVFSVIFVYIMHYAKYVIHVFALLSLSLLVTWLLHMLCWNKDHKTNYQFYSQLFQALTPVSIDVKGSPLVKSDSKPPPKKHPKIKFRHMHHIRSKLFHYLFRNYIPCTTHVWKTPLQSEFKRIQTYSNRLWYCRSQSFQTCCHLKKNEINIRSF
jgi:hypothetical protein